MRVTDMNRLSFCSVREDDPDDCDPATFLSPREETSADGLTTTYTFSGTYQANDLHEATSVSNIIITVKRSPDLAVGDVVTVDVPAALLPLRNTNVQENVDGDPVSMSVTVSHPLHVYYKVAPKPDVVAALGDPLSLNASDPDAGAALAQYVRDNTVDGRVRLYSNDWNPAATDPGTVARSTSAFVPAAENDFYRFASDSTIYSDEAGTVPVPASEWDALPDDAALTFRVIAYELTGPGAEPTKEEVVLPTTKAALTRAGLTAADAVDGVITAPAGLPDLSGRAYNLDHVKCLALTWEDNLPRCTDPAGSPAPGNATATDDMVRSTTWPGEGAAVVTVLGNNGYLEYEVPGRLIISKQVEADPALNPDPEAEFAFEVALTGAPADAEFPYAVYDGSDRTTPVREGVLAATGGAISLRAGQEAEVIGLPDGTGWTVVEQDLPPGYEPEAPGTAPSGQIAVPQAAPARADFVNAYRPSPTAPLAGPAVAKTLEGRPWDPGDAFTVRMCPSDDSDPEACEDLTLTQAAPSGRFAERTFDAPGTFTFAIVETGDAGPGITTSAAEYLWTVVVTDDGSGTLVVESAALTRVRDDAGGTADEAADVAAFGNAFDADEVGVHLPVTKLVRDLTLSEGEQDRAPTVPHEFEFRLLGTSEGAPPAPLFGGEASAVAATTPDAGSAVSPELSFTTAHGGNSFFYAVTEIEGGLAGVTYSGAAFVYRLTVETDAAAGALRVTTDVCRTTADALTDAPDGGCGTFDLGADDVEFLNEYAAAPVAASISASKRVVGGPWADGDSFTFRLDPHGDETQAAVEAGDVVLPAERTVTVGSADAADDAARVPFDEITFTRQGTYSFRVTESAEPGDGVTGDPRWLVFDVVVTDAELDGQLEAVVTPGGDEDEATFVNRWSASATFAGAMLLKSLDGRDIRPGEFAFSVVPADEPSAELAGLPMAGGTVENGDGTGDPASSLLLRGLVVTQDDLDRSFSYTITEAGRSIGGVTVDPVTWTVTLVPTFDEEARALDIVTTVSDGEREETFSSLAGETPRVSFANTYAAAPVAVAPQFSKGVFGRDWRPGETFTFRLTALTEGAPLPETTTVVVGEAEAAAFGFGEIVFTEPGEFSYSVREVVPADADPDLEYDIGEAVATVIVTDDLNGSLTAEVVFDGDQAFENVRLPEAPPLPPGPGPGPDPGPDPDPGPGPDPGQGGGAGPGEEDEGGALATTGASIAGALLLAALLIALGARLARRRHDEAA